MASCGLKMQVGMQHNDWLQCLCSAAYSGVGAWSGDGADGNQALQVPPLTREEVLAAYAAMQGALPMLQLLICPEGATEVCLQSAVQAYWSLLRDQQDGWNC